MIRLPTSKDTGRVAYLVMRWNNELPVWLQGVEGGAAHAQVIAEAVINSPRFVGRVLEINNKIVGGFCIYEAENIFSTKRYGQLLMWYVEPEHRGGLHGLRLLKEALKIAEENKLSWLEVRPWADDAGAQHVLPRLGFFNTYNVFAKRTRPWAAVA